MIENYASPWNNSKCTKQYINQEMDLMQFAKGLITGENLASDSLASDSLSS